MNLRIRRTLLTDGTRSWSGIDAGRRVQVGMQVTDIRHFRVSGGGVKHGHALSQSPRSVESVFSLLARNFVVRLLGAAMAARARKRFAEA